MYCIRQRITKKCKYMSNNTEVLNQFERTYKSYYSVNMRNVFKIYAGGQGTAFRKYVAWSFILVSDEQTHSCLVPFKTAIIPLCDGINFTRML